MRRGCCETRRGSGLTHPRGGLSTSCQRVLEQAMLSQLRKLSTPRCRGQRHCQRHRDPTRSADTVQSAQSSTSDVQMCCCQSVCQCKYPEPCASRRTGPRWRLSRSSAGAQTDRAQPAAERTQRILKMFATSRRGRVDVGDLPCGRGRHRPAGPSIAPADRDQLATSSRSSAGRRTGATLVLMHAAMQR